MQSQKIEIKLSKTKIFLISIGSLMFIILGIYLAFYHINTSIRHSSLYVKFVGLLSIAFFSITFIVSLIKIFDSKSGLIISDKGIYDNSTFVSLGFIKWEDILEIEIKEISNNKFFILYLKNAEQYIQASKGFKKRIASINYKTYGSPASISTNGLKISFSKLDTLLKTRFLEYNNSKN